MTYKTLVSTSEVISHLKDPDWAILDCRYTLQEPERGRRDYLKSHIPGAVYAHLDEDLSSPPIPGVTGRHPLPFIDSLAAKFSEWGIGPGTQVVAYDDWPGASGAIAARLWWCLRWLGHDAAAVLDGGWERWLEVGGPVSAGAETRPPAQFISRPRPELQVNVAEVDAMRLDPAYRVFDSRAADRYRGENETVDPVAGHIPGAPNAPYADNIGPGGLFRPAGELRQRFSAMLGDLPAQNVVFYCGSGVTATHNLLAMLHAGLGEARLYAGSWSEWITDPHRPVSTGEG